MAARNILVEGLSGTGKSTSWENIPSKEAVVISPNAKALPFRGSSSKYSKENKNLLISNKLTDIPVFLKAINERPEIKYVLIDDFTHYQNARMMDAGFMNDKGFQKWATFGKDVFNTITGTTESLRNDLTIVYMSHVELSNDSLYVMKSSGKLLDNTIDPVSYFTYVFHTDIVKKSDDKVEYSFLTNSDGVKQAKTPKGCFKTLHIPNDMMQVIKTIEEYEKGE